MWRTSWGIGFVPFASINTPAFVALQWVYWTRWRKKCYHAAIVRRPSHSERWKLPGISTGTVVKDIPLLLIPSCMSHIPHFLKMIFLLARWDMWCLFSPILYQPWCFKDFPSSRFWQEGRWIWASIDRSDPECLVTSSIFLSIWETHVSRLFLFWGK